MTTGASATVPARAHLAGNPSDGYGGAVLSTTIDHFAATVAVTASNRVRVAGPETSWTSIDALVEESHRLGHEGGDRLVRAALVTLASRLPSTRRLRPGRFAWSTTIPRSVGLGGSSALVIATMRAALEWWEVTDPPDDLAIARAALATETDELGIAAGLADRTVQVLGGTVHTDCRGAAAARPVSPGGHVRFRLLWSEAAASPSGEFHGRLRAAVAADEGGSRRELLTLATLADDAAAALAVGDVDRLASTVDESLAARRRLGPVPPAALDGVDALREQGAAVNFAGSGGALVVLGPGAVPTGWSSIDVALG